MGKLKELRDHIAKDGGGASAGTYASVAHTTFTPTVIEPEYPGDKKRKKELLKEWVDKAKRIGAPAEAPKESHLTKPAGLSSVKPMAPSEAPGPPPRPGLKWSTGTHRWVKDTAGMGGMSVSGEGGAPGQGEEDIIQQYNDELIAEFHTGDALFHALVFSEFLKFHGVDAYPISIENNAAVEMVDEQGVSTYVDPVGDNLEPSEGYINIFPEGNPERYEFKDLPDDHKKELAKTLIDELQNDIMEKGVAPGPPPRPGLQWKPETSRWIRPESPYTDKVSSYIGMEKFREMTPALASSAPRGTEAMIKYLVEEIPDNASAFTGMISWLERYSILSMNGKETSDEIVDSLYKDANKKEHLITFNLRKVFEEAHKDPSRLNKVLAIDAFVHFIHDRGSALPQIFGAIDLKTPKDEMHHESYYRDRVWTNLDDIVQGILDELATRANMDPEVKSANESLGKFMAQTRGSAYGKDDLNEWVNQADLTLSEDTLEDIPRKASDTMPDPFSVEFYDWVEKQLKIGGKQITGVKGTGTQLEANLYSSLLKDCNDFLDKINPKTPQHEVVHGLGDVIEKWVREQSISMSEAFDKLYKAGFYAGVINTGVKPAMRLADELALRLLKTDPNRIGSRIKLFSQDVVLRFNKIISQAYQPTGDFWLSGMMKEMREVVPAQRYQIERIVRTEVATVSNSGRLLGWSEDPYKYYYDYIWNATYDNRAKFISLWRANQNPLTYDEAVFLWEHQSQTFNGKAMNDTFNQRCSLSRTPIDNERKGNRWDNDGTFIATLSLGF